MSYNLLIVITMAKPIRANMPLFYPFEFFFPQRNMISFLIFYFKITHFGPSNFSFFKNGSLDKINLPNFLEKVNQGSFSFNIKKIHQFYFLLLIN